SDHRRGPSHSLRAFSISCPGVPGDDSRDAYLLPSEPRIRLADHRSPKRPVPEGVLVSGGDEEFVGKRRHPGAAGLVHGAHVRAWRMVDDSFLWFATD